MTPKLFDTHCHVHFNAYRDDMDEVIRRALDAEVWMILVGTHSTTSKNGIEIASNYPEGVYATVGVHPNHTCEQTIFPDDQELPASKIKTRCEDFDPEYFMPLTKHPKVVAIGEIGLDYFWIPKEADREAVIAQQKSVAHKALQAAHDANLPVVIHCRDAHADIVELLDEFLNEGKLKRKGQIHCFTGTEAEAKEYVRRGFYVSFTGIITFAPKKSTPEIQEELWRAVKAVPLEQMLIETDSPYLTPGEHRGKRNEPVYVRNVAEKVAELKGISFDEVAGQTTQNAMKFFGISGSRVEARDDADSSS